MRICLRGDAHTKFGPGIEQQAVRDAPIYMCRLQGLLELAILKSTGFLDEEIAWWHLCSLVVFQNPFLFAPASSIAKLFIHGCV